MAPSPKQQGMHGTMASGWLLVLLVVVGVRALVVVVVVGASALVVVVVASEVLHLQCCNVV